MNKEKLNEFIEKLKSRYAEMRGLLEGLDDSQIIESNNFKNCYKIASILFTVNSTGRIGKEAFYALSNDVNYDIDSFLDLWDVEINKDENNNINPRLIPKNESAKNITSQQ